ncbi:MAG: GNAT family N-acetyltransferase [Bacteroidales bacterium]
MLILRGEKLKMRAMEPADLDLIYQWENDPETWIYSNTYTPFSRFHLEQFILNSQGDIFTDKQLRLMITDPQGTTVGCADLFEFDARNRRAGVGILIAREFRRMGYASEALDIVIHYAHQVLNLHQLFCNIAANNKVSIRLFTQKGFEKCGHKKQWLLQQNHFTDELMYQLVFQV